MSSAPELGSEKIKLPRVSPDDLMSTHSTALTSLASASYHGDVGRVSQLLKRDSSLAHEIDDKGRTALHFAAYQSAVSVATTLLCTVLESDVVAPFKRTIRDLRQRTLDLEKSLVSEEDHRLCEQWLSEEKERQCLDFQIQCITTAAQILSRSDQSGCTPLHYAATTRDDTLTELLRYPEDFAREQLSSGALRALIGKKGGGPGHGVKEDSALREERERREDRLQRRTARLTRDIWKPLVNNIDSRKNTVLHFAACSGSTSAVRTLVRWGEDHTLSNDVGQTPLDVAEDKTCRAALLRLPQAVDEACDRRLKSVTATGSDVTTGMDGAIKSLLDHGEHVDATSSIQGETALHRACSRGARSLVVGLLDGNGADPHTTDANGWTGLHWCGYYSTKEHGTIARDLLNRDVDVDARTLRGRTPLHLAVLQDHVSDKTGTEKKQQRHRTEGRKGRRGQVDENTRTHKRMPEYKQLRTRESSMNVVSMIELLARRGADLEALDVSGRTALHFAAKKGDPRVLYSLLLLGANVYTTTRNRSNALHIAVESSRKMCIRLLVRYDAEKRQLKQGRDSSNRIPADAAPDQRTRDSLVSLWEACEDGKLELTRRLLLDNPSTSPTNPMEPWLPVGLMDITTPRRLSCLHLVARGAGRLCKNTKAMLDKAKRKDRGTKVNGSMQKTLDLKMNGYRQIVALLLRRGCKISVKDLNGMTPLMVAAMEGASSLIAVLVTGSATGKGNVNKTDDEMDRIDRLLSEEDKSGNTAMHYAMAFRQIAAANSLEALGADTLAENRRGETATSVAGIGIQLASHLRKKRQKSGGSSGWRSDVTAENANSEGKRDDTPSTSRPAPPPQRRPAPPPSSTNNDNDDGDDFEDDFEDENTNATDILRASARDMTGGNVIASRPAARPSVRPAARPADRTAATNLLRASAAALDDDDDVVVASRPAASRPSAAKPPSRSSTMKASRPAPSRPTSRSRTATSSLQTVAASIV